MIKLISIATGMEVGKIDLDAGGRLVLSGDLPRSMRMTAHGRSLSDAEFYDFYRSPWSNGYIKAEES